MRSVAQFLAQGLESLSDLQQALQAAIQLEFSTIPPYLCAQWSVVDDFAAENTLESIVLEEMGHMGTACNLLTAIGGVPRIAHSAFVPTYPTNGLPGGVHPGLVVDLGPLDAAQLEVFMEIEKPEFPPLGLLAVREYPTIGEFYDAISEAFQRLQPAFVDGHQVWSADVGVVPITCVAEAISAIQTIKVQGEGTPQTPDAGGHPAHYYQFRALARLPQLPQVWPFAPPPNPNACANFNAIFSNLLKALEETWTLNSARLGAAVANMLALEDEGTRLIQAGIRPEFRFVGAAPAPQTTCSSRSQSQFRESTHATAHTSDAADRG